MLLTCLAEEELSNCPYLLPVVMGWKIPVDENTASLSVLQLTSTIVYFNHVDTFTV